MKWRIIIALLLVGLGILKNNPVIEILLPLFVLGGLPVIRMFFSAIFRDL